MRVVGTFGTNDTTTRYPGRIVFIPEQYSHVVGAGGGYPREELERCTHDVTPERCDRDVEQRQQRVQDSVVEHREQVYTRETVLALLL